MSAFTTLLIQSSLTRVKRVLLGSSAIAILSLSLVMSSQAADVEAVYNDSCAACHDSGALSAIKKSDRAKWQTLIQQKGMPALIDAVKNGSIQMPAGGLCKTCSDEDYRQLIEYMAQ